MKTFSTFVTLLFLSIICSSQGFYVNSYLEFKKSISGISESELQNIYPRPNSNYIKGFSVEPDIKSIQYLDSAIQKLELTTDEMELLKLNRFVVTERLNYPTFGQAFHTIYNYDLPVFVTSDAILHALHMSYDQILKTLERQIMAGNLEESLKWMYDNFQVILDKYQNTETELLGLKDADLYITIAYSLITDKLQEGNFEDQEKIKGVWTKIQEEKLVEMPLFTFPERKRKLDFSQFTVRGHYVFTQQDEWMGLKSLEPYFKTMMWLGRIDFLLTPPPPNPWEEPWKTEEILRMNKGAFMVNELVELSTTKELLEFNEKVINYLVGESDNITPDEFSTILSEQEISSASQLNDSVTFTNLLNTINSNPALAQKIMSDFFFVDPNSTVPGNLPVSYRLSGQRFIIDSYILANVVFDRVVYNNQKIMRMMPNPLDVIFSLGNNDVLALLTDEFKKYPYFEQLASLRYLVDEKDENYWNKSLYNVWLNSIRELNPAEENSQQPLFMRTAAWHHEKINTQLASWSHLRHDNLLYAKQSYTGGTGCSFPFSYVEPYPAFYGKLKDFAQNAGEFFSEIPSGNYELTRIAQFFPHFKEVMEKLEILAEKQLHHISFTSSENEWLQTMLFQVNRSGEPPYSGWYSSLFYDVWDAAEGDFTIVDVHTQPTDEYGNVVGKVLHTGVGKINLGVFIANCPGNYTQEMAFVGPTLSYYETISHQFKRMTDQEWEQLVYANELPDRPNWTHIYLAGEKGERKEKAIELPSKVFTKVIHPEFQSEKVHLYPNPANNQLSISFTNSIRNVSIKVYNTNGILVKQLTEISPGKNHIEMNVSDLNTGIYLVKISAENKGTFVSKLIKK